MKSECQYHCKYCNFHTQLEYNWKRHIITEKHKNKTLSTECDLLDELQQVNEQQILCNECNYVCLSQSDYSKHISTKKHIMALDKTQKKERKTHCCNYCDKQYANASGVWKHMKTCNKIENLKKTEVKDTDKGEVKDTDKGEIKDISSLLTPENFMFLLNQNKELQNIVLQTNTTVLNVQNTMVQQGQQMLEVCKNNHVAHHTTNTNSHNTNNFNLQFFLNDTCKDALNFSEFMNSIVLNMDDLENTGKLGYVNGISRIFINALRNTELERRPLHCTDVKREIVYFKECDKWEKDTADNETVKRGIQYLADKNMSKIKDWKEQNPKSLEMNTPESDELTKLYTAVICSDDEKETKIMRNVLKEVLVKTKLREIEV